MTFSAYKKELVEALTPVFGAGEALSIASMVIEKLTGKPRAMQFQTTNLTISIEQTLLLETYREELLQSKPVQYVLKEAWFLDRKFFVNESVLIPRPETEELVMLTIETLQQKGLKDKPIHILDIGTGSGCIAISLALASKDYSVTGMDISPRALEVATQNSQTLGANVHWLKADFLDPAQWARFANYQVIISNPPYIPLAEKAMLDKNVTEWEPGLALFTPDDDAFIFYKAMASFCKKYPLAERRLLLEGHQNYMGELEIIFSEVFMQVEIKKDIHGNKRMLLAYN